MKIIFLGDSISTQKAGIHYYGLGLIQYILQRYPQHDYSIISSKKIDVIPIPQIIVPVNKSVPMHLRIRQLWKIPKIINSLKPDLVVELAHFGPFNLDEGIKRVTVIHDLTPIKFPHLHPWQSVWAHRLFLKNIVKAADFIIVNSEATKSDLIALYQKPSSNICICFPVIPAFTSIQLAEEKGASILRSYFLTVGTLEPRKNHITILRAFEKFCQRNHDLELIIVGSKGWRNRDFRKLLDQSPVMHRVKLMGYVSRAELGKIYKNATAFIFASIYEGFGIPILEAQSFGLPLILSDNKSVPSPAREAALMFDISDADQLEQHMHRIVHEPALREQLQEKSRDGYTTIVSQMPNLDPIFCA